MAVAFNINTIAIYDRTELTKHILYGDQRMTDDDGSFFKEDNYIPNFREDGIFVIDNINYFETKAPAVYKVYSEYGIVQAVQYIIGGDIKKNNNIISYGRFKLDKKWAESDMNFLAIIGDYIGRVFLKERNMINRYVALDVETTGLNPAVDRIIEVGMARVEDGQITQKYSTLVYPGISVSERITELTGIHNEELAGKPRIEEIIGDITRFIGDWPILGHNVTFDFSFLKRAAVNNGYTITDDGIDTLKIARRLLPELEHKNLSFCASILILIREGHTGLMMMQ